MKNSKTIQTVQEYNAQFPAYCLGMMFLTKNGSPLKKGFVVTINGSNKLVKDLQQAEAVSEKDFITEAVLPCYSHGGANTIISEMNN